MQGSPTIDQIAGINPRSKTILRQVFGTMTIHEYRRMPREELIYTAGMTSMEIDDIEKALRQAGH